MKIGIIGQGFVGTAVNEGLKQHFPIETYDIAKDSTCKSIDELAIKSDVVFVCLPTPMRENGECYLGILEEVINDLNTTNRCKTIVIKSTIPPGTTEKWNKIYDNIDIIFNPEFLTEANSIEDFKNQNRIIIGGPRPASTKVKRIFDKAFPKVKIIKTNSTYAEMVKYTTNCFLATKVAFANEMYKVCEALNIDYDKIMEYALYDKRLGNSHWNVPGPDGDFGFGGHCFPKDMEALKYRASELGVYTSIIDAALKSNNKVRKNRDWENQKGRAVI